MAGLLGVVPYSIGVRYLDENGKVSVFRFKDNGGCTRKLPELVKPLRQRGIVRDGQIGDTKSILLPAREALDFMTEVLADDPSKNFVTKHCVCGAER